MSRTIDERVVTLQFDNAEFERNVKTSMSTLDKLDKSLKFKDGEKGFEKIQDAARKTDLNPVLKATVTIGEGFSAMERIAINVLSSIAIRAEQAGERLVKSLTIDNIQSGYNKYEEKIASVQTLVNSTGKSVEEIGGYLDKLMWFADETSYSFTDMTSSLAQLTSSGGDVNKLLPMIMGIANATAFAGKQSAEFSRAIYNLNQSYGSGALKYMDWKSLELAGVASKDLKQTFIETAIELGRLDEAGKTANGTLVDIASFGQTLKENWADTEVMEAAFGKFYQYTEQAYQMIQEGQFETASDAYKYLANIYDDVYIRAAKAAQEAKTFSEAIEATKDAVSTKWLKSFDIIFGDYDQAKETWTNLANDLWEIFASGGDTRNDILAKAFKDDFSQLKEIFKSGGGNFEEFTKGFTDYLEQSGWDVGKLVKEYGSLNNAIAKNGSISHQVLSQNTNLSKQLRKYISETNVDFLELNESLSDTADATKQVQKIFDDVWEGIYGNGQERYEKLTRAGMDYATVQGLINKLASEGHRAGYNLLTDDIAHLTDEQLKSIGVTREQADVMSDVLDEMREQAVKANTDLDTLLKKMGRKSGQILLSESISNVTKSVIALKDAVGEAWSEVFNIDLADVIYGILTRINEFTESLRYTIENSDTLRSVLTTLFEVVKIVGKGFEFVSEVVKQLIRAGLEVLKTIFKDINIEVGDFSDILSNAMDKAIEWIRNNDVIIQMVQTAANGLSIAIGYVRDWINSIADMEEVGTIVNGVKNSFDEFVKSDFSFAKLKDGYKDLVKSIELGSKDPFKGLGENVIKFGSSLGESLVKLKDTVFSTFKDVFGKISISEERLEKFREVISRTTETLLGLGAGYMVLNIFKNISDAASTLASPLRTFSDLIGSIQGTFYSIQGYINAAKANMWVNNVLKIAGAIGILAAAIYAISVVGKSGNLWTAILQTAALLAVVTGFVFAITYIGRMGANGDSQKAEKNLKDMAKVILAIGASLVLMSVALKTINGLDTKKLYTNGLALIIGMGAMVYAVAKMKELGGKGTAALTDMIGFSIALVLFAYSVKKLDNLKLEHPWQVMVSLLAIVGFMVAISWGLKSVNKGSALVLTGFAVTMASLVKIIEKIAKVSDVTYLKGVLRMIPIVGALGIIIGLLSKIPTGSATSSAAYVVGVAIAVYGIAEAIEKLGKIKNDQLIKGGVAAVTLFAIIGAIGGLISQLAMVDGANIKSAISASLIMVVAAGSLYIMAGAIMLFKNMDATGLAKGVGTIAALLVSMGYMFKLMGQGGIFGQEYAYQAVNALSKISAMLIILSISLAALSFIPFERLATATLALTFTIGALAGLMLSLNTLDIGKENSIWKKLPVLIIILASISAVLALLSNMPNVDKALPVAESLSKIILSLSGMMFAMSLASTIGSGVSGLGKFITTLGVITGVILGLAGIMAAVEQFSPWLSEKGPAILDRLGEILTKIAEICGGTLGALIGSIGTGFTDQLVKIGENLSKFSEAVQGFVNIQVPEDFGTTIENIAKIFSSLGPQISNIISLSSLKGSASNLKIFFTDFATSITTLSEAMGDVDVEKVNAAAAVGNMFAALNDSLGPNGFVSFITGKQTLSGFSGNLKEFGNGLVEFSKSLGSFDPDLVSKALPMIKEIMDMEGNLESSWSLLGWIAGKNNDFGDFGERLKGFGKGLSDFSKELKSFNPESVGAAVEAGKALSALESGIQSSSSLIGWLYGGDNGNKDLGDFGNRIQEFATGLVNGLNALATLSNTYGGVSDDFVGPLLADGMQGVDFAKVNENIDQLISIGSKFSELEATLSSSETLIGSQSKIGTFGDGLAKFGVGFKGFMDNYPTNLPDDESVSRMVNVLKQFTEFAGGDLASADSGGILASIGNGFKTFGTGISDFFNNMFGAGEAGAEEGSESSGSSVIEKIGQLFTNDEITEQAEEGAEHTGSMYLGSLGDVFTKSEALTKVDKVMKETAAKLIKHFEEDEKHVSYKTHMQEIGANYIQGLIEGLASMEHALYAKAQSIASNVTGIIKSNWVVASPSKVAYGIGEYFMMGITNGISDMSQSAVDAAEDMAYSVSNAVLDAMIISDQILENQLSPIISPVLDTNGVLYGANVISGLLNSGASYDAALSVEQARGLRASLENQNSSRAGALLTMNNTFEINGVSDINDPALINDMANKLYNRINILLGNAI